MLKLRKSLFALYKFVYKKTGNMKSFIWTELVLMTSSTQLMQENDFFYTRTFLRIEARIPNEISHAN